MDVFQRRELKFIVNARQRAALEELMLQHMEPDKFGNSTICNLYYDTPDYRLIRHSLEKPVYKEKLRLRSYGQIKDGVDVFMKEARANGIGGKCIDRIQHSDFIKRMDLAYAVADVVISRSGASSVSELCAAEKAVIFVPSPNVAEDHQTHNAMALVNKDAALLVRDSEAQEKLMAEACALIENPEKIALLEKNISRLALRDAALTIADEIYKIVK